MKEQTRTPTRGLCACIMQTKSFPVRPTPNLSARHFFSLAHNLSTCFLEASLISSPLLYLCRKRKFEILREPTLSHLADWHAIHQVFFATPTVSSSTSWRWASCPISQQRPIALHLIYHLLFYAGGGNSGQ